MLKMKKKKYVGTLKILKKKNKVLIKFIMHF